LAAASDEARPIRFGWANGVGDTYVCGLRIGLCQLPWHASGFGVECQANSPHYARAVWIGEGTVFAHQLKRESTGSGGGLQVIMQIEVLSRPADIASCPSLRNVDEQDIELSAAGLETLDRTQQALGKDDVWPRGGTKVGFKLIVELDIATSASGAHIKTENVAKARPLREIFLSLGRPKARVEVLHESVEASALTGWGYGSHADGVRHQVS
jgi:hypothetical protein